MKAYKSLFSYRIYLVSSAGCIWCFHTRAPSGLRMEIYYWSQNRASLKDRMAIAASV